MKILAIILMLFPVLFAVAITIMAYGIQRATVLWLVSFLVVCPMALGAWLWTKTQSPFPTWFISNKPHYGEFKESNWKNAEELR